jgi:hypothetical protein
VITQTVFFETSPRLELDNYKFIIERRMPPENEDEFGVISKGRKNDWLDMPQDIK